MQNKSKPTISLVIPAYKAEKFIKSVVEMRIKELQAIGVPFEIIVVLDGFSDKSANTLNKIKHKGLKVFHYQRNRGKGFAVRYGMSKARGEYIGYIDAGKDVLKGNIARMFERIRQKDADAVIPSKWVKDSRIIYPLSRKLYSKFYNFFLRVLLGINVSDTQVGAKLYTHQLVKRVLPRLMVKRFAFEAEFLAVAKHLGFKRFVEVPVDIREDDKSTITYYDGLKSFWDTFAVFYRLRISKFYDKHPQGKMFAQELKNLILIV